MVQREEITRARRLRKAMPETEIILWAALRRKALGYRFRRQHPIGPYVIDFYCSEARLCIEVDGGSHFADTAAEKYDRDRARFLEENGYHLQRFTNDEVHAHLPDVFCAIHARCREMTPAVK